MVYAGRPRTFPHPLESSRGGRSPSPQELRVQAVSGVGVAPKRPQLAAHRNPPSEQNRGGVCLHARLLSRLLSRACACFRARVLACALAYALACVRRRFARFRAFFSLRFLP